MIAMLVKTGGASDRVTSLDISSNDCYEIRKAGNILSIRPLLLRMRSFVGLS